MSPEPTEAGVVTYEAPPGRVVVDRLGSRHAATTDAGAELTTIYGLSQDRRKQTGRDPRVLPKVVPYDPALSLSLPAQVTGPSRMNALAHCVEAFHGPGANRISAALATEGIRALAAGLRCSAAGWASP